MHLVTDAENNAAGYFTDGPPGTVVNANFLNSILREIKTVIEAAGLGLASAEADTNDQLLSALTTHFYPSNYDRVVKTQDEFNALFTRTGANAYVIANGIRSVYIRNTGVAYNCSGPTSFLSGGDTYAEIKTNNCVNLVCDPGAYFYFEDTLGLVECNTANSNITNLWVRGLGTIAVGVQTSILINATGVHLKGCRITNRQISGNNSGFRNLLANTDDTVFLENCSVENITATDSFHGFRYCNNLSFCKATDFNGGNGDTLTGFYSCIGLNGCVVKTFSATDNCISKGFDSCTLLSNCRALDIVSSGSGVVQGFSNCGELNACYVSTCESHDGIISGFISCLNMSACKSSVLCSGVSLAYAYNSCEALSASSATTESSGNDTCGFYTCSRLSSCIASSIVATGGGDEALGFSGCSEISACYAVNITGTTAEGFNDCVHGSALETDEAANSGNTYMDSADVQIVAKYSIEDIFT